MFHDAQGFPKFAIMKAYVVEKEKFVTNTRPIPKSSLPANANFVSSHAVYCIKTEDDDSLLLKARIAHYGNEDSDTENLRSDCCMCPSLGIDVVLSTAAIRRWRIVRIDVKSAFLQSGPAELCAHAKPPRESRRKNEV